MYYPNNPNLRQFFFFFDEEGAQIPWHECSDVDAILQHGQKLLGHSLAQMHEEARSNVGKGGLGQAVEKYHFGYEPNSESEPDFVAAGMELKCTPLRKLADGSLGAKERLVLNIINYIEEADKTFETSSFWHKNKLLLLMFYLHETGVNPVDMIFKLVRTWRFDDVDLKIIQDDWQFLHDKIATGHAHEISEGDTFYLAACTKGSKSGAEMREQPRTTIKAQQRAYSLKASYMNQIILESYLDSSIRHNLQILPKRLAKLQKERADRAIKSTQAYKQAETFEQLIDRRFQPYYGKTIGEIQKLTKTTFSIQAKDYGYNVCRAILGVKSKQVSEFVKAGIILKAIQLEASMDKIKESISFPFMHYLEIAQQEWEESDWCATISSKFLFAIFRKSKDGQRVNSQLVKVVFWNMPVVDMKYPQELWEDTKNKILADRYSSFITTKTHPVCHVRPHAKDAADTTDTPQGHKEKKMCFWLNNDYILNAIKGKL